MASSGRARLTLRLGALAFLVLAFLPYYSHTPGPTAGVGLPNVELPGIGALPGEKEATTVVRVGLPFSPIFHYHKKTTFESETKTVPASEMSKTLQLKSGDAAFTGSVTTTSFRSGFNYNWRVEFFSWSSALALLGIGLLVASFWKWRVPSPAAPASGNLIKGTESGEPPFGG